MIIPEISQNQIEIICKKHKVRSLYLFGSMAKGKANHASDADLLVQFDHIELSKYFENFMQLKDDFESLFQRRIDLIEDQAIRNPIFRKVVDRDKKLIYGRGLNSHLRLNFLSNYSSENSPLS